MLRTKFAPFSLATDSMNNFKAFGLGLALAMAGVTSAHALDESSADDEVAAEVADDSAFIDAAISVDQNQAGSGSLSVNPESDAVYPETRPDWVDGTPDLNAKPVVWPIKSLLRATPEEARESLQVQARGVMAAYAELVMESQGLEGKDTERLLASYLKEVELDLLPAEDRYSGTAQVGEETVYEEAARLRFDEKFGRRLVRAWKEDEVEHRLGILGVAGGAGLCLLLAGTGLVRRIARKHENA
jgi:hypothetical protein